MTRRTLGIGFLLLIAAGPAAAETVTFVDWNLLGFPGSTGVERLPYYRTVLEDIGPDLVAAEEVSGVAGFDLFLSGVLDAMEPGEWAGGYFHDGYDSDRALYYRASKLEVIDAGYLDTALRDIDWWQMRSLATGDEFRVYAAHLKASTGSTNEQKRLAECTILRAALDALPAELPFLLAGDFNIYTASEPAFQLLISAGDGQLIDPIDQVGNWHDNAAYAPIHTQSTRTLSFGGGATGGLDDRFDMILVSEEMLDGAGVDIDPASYQAWGNDGAHLNVSILEGGNAAVSAAVAEALYQASDHLPVRATFTLEEATTVADAAPARGPRIAAAPNPFNPSTTIRFEAPGAGATTLAVFDARGRRVRELLADRAGAGAARTVWDGTDDRGTPVPSGVYFARIATDDAAAAVRLVLVR